METYKNHSLYKKLDSDSVIGETFKFYKKHFVTLFLLSFVVNLIIQLPIYQLGLYDYSKYFEYPYQIPAKELIASVGIICLIVLIIYSLAHLFICKYVYRIESKNNSFMSIFKSTVSNYYLKFIVAGIVSMIIFMIGSMTGIIIFFVGIFLTMLYFGTVLTPVCPVLIIENKDPFESVGRSFSLTHKDFWGALGAILLLIILLIIVSVFISILTIIPFAFDVLSDVLKGENILEILKNKDLFDTKFGAIGMVTNIAFSALTFPIFPIFSVILYFKLKFAEDNKEPGFENRPY